MSAYWAQCTLPTHPIYQTLLFNFFLVLRLGWNVPQGTLYPMVDCPLLVQNVPLSSLQFRT